jgi:3-methyladenine DNA glycosylase AlkC
MYFNITKALKVVENNSEFQKELQKLPPIAATRPPLLKSFEASNKKKNTFDEVSISSSLPALYNLYVQRSENQSINDESYKNNENKNSQVTINTPQPQAVSLKKLRLISIQNKILIHKFF